MWSGALSFGVASARNTAGAQQPGALSRATLTRLDRPEVSDVRFEGVKNVDAGALADGLVTQASHCKSLLLRPFCLLTKTPLFYQREYLDRTELKRDVLRALILYYRHGYRDAVVDTEIQPPAATKVRVVFRINEGPPTTVAQFDIDTPPRLLPRKTLKPDAIRLQVGQPFDLYALDSTVTNIGTAVYGRGYASARIDTATTFLPPRNGTPAVAERIRVTPGKLVRIRSVIISYQGDSTVGRRTIERSLTFKPGDLWIRGESTQNRRALYLSGMFRRVAIQRTPIKDSAGTVNDTLTDVTVQVTPAPLHDVQAQVGFNTVEFLQISSTFTANDFLGGGRQLTIRGGLSNLLATALNGQVPFEDVIRASGAGQFGLDTRPFLRPNWQAGVDLSQPWFLAPENTLGVGAFVRRRSAPGVFVELGYGGNATFSRTLGDRSSIGLRYQFEETKTTAAEVYFCVNFGICDQPTLQTFGGFQTLSPLALVWNIDRSNNQYYPIGYPTSGFAAKAEVAHASALTASDYRFNRASADAAWYTAIGVPRGVLALHARAGWVRALSSTGRALGVPTDDHILNPRVRFYAGGANSVRGFGENLLGPRILTIPPDSLRYKVVKFSTNITQVFVFCAPDRPIQSCSLNPPPIPFPNQSGKKSQAVLSDQEFTPRPLGGNSLLEGSVEYRFPLMGALGGAAFVDGAIVGSGLGNEGEPVHAAGAITPGIGIRYYSSVGPIRVDLGLNPLTTDNLIVLTQTGIGPTARLVEVNGHRTYAPAKTEASFAGFFQRVALHLSIGQAF